MHRLEGMRDRFMKDICGGLPVEILLCIVKYLELDEIVRARRVSQTWNERFSDPEFCIGVLKIHFRGTWENHYNKNLRGEEKQTERVRLAAWLAGAAKRRIQRKRGEFHHVSFFVEARDPEDWTSDVYQYSNGRVAFKRREGICVKDLDVSMLFKTSSSR